MYSRIAVLCFFLLLLIIKKPVALNDLQSMGVAGVDFSGAGTHVPIALFLINSDEATGFDVTFTFTNTGKFVCDALVPKIGATLSAIPMTGLYLRKVSGTIGDGLQDPDQDENILDDFSGNVYFWNPGLAQSTPTISYIVELNASWDKPMKKLAGFYLEGIQAIISVGL